MQDFIAPSSESSITLSSSCTPLPIPNTIFPPYAEPSQHNSLELPCLVENVKTSSVVNSLFSAVGGKHRGETVSVKNENYSRLANSSASYRLIGPLSAVIALFSASL